MFSNGNCVVLESPNVHDSSPTEHSWNGNTVMAEVPLVLQENAHNLDLPELVVGLPLLGRPSSILKKKSVDESSQILSLTVQNTNTKPVSILKRKTSQEEGNSKFYGIITNNLDIVHFQVLSLFILC